MQHRPEVTRNAIVYHLPQSAIDVVRGRARMLSATMLRIWLLVAPAAFLTDAWLEPAWPALLLIATGAGLSTLALLRARPQQRRRPPVANLSAASSCVWKMDIEG